MGHIMPHRFAWGFLVGFGVAFGLSPIGAALNRAPTPGVGAAEKTPRGTFVNLINFPPVKPGKEAEFLEWFRWSNEVYVRHKGFISRTLLKASEGQPAYVGIVEHQSRETFMAMHLSRDREEAFKRVEPLLEVKPTPHFYEVVISHRR